MKSESSVFSQLLQNVSAALIIAAGASWLLLAAVTEYFDKDHTLKTECTVSAHSDSENCPSAKCISIRTAKQTLLSSSRRPESIIQAPFALSAIQNKSSQNNVFTEKITFQQGYAALANYVRAGPVEQYA